MHFSNVRGTSGTNGLTSHLSTSVLGGETAIIVQSVARSLSFEPALVDDGNRPAKMGGPAEPCSPRTPPSVSHAYPLSHSEPPGGECDSHPHCADKNPGAERGSAGVMWVAGERAGNWLMLPPPRACPHHRHRGLAGVARDDALAS